MDFRILIDSREQAPYEFDCAKHVTALTAGDYSVDGYALQVAIERKSLADFVHTVVHDWHRFYRELDRLRAFDAAGIVVEADLNAVLRGLKQDVLRGVSPQTVLGASVHITLRYGVSVFWCGSRQAARAFTEAYLRSFVRLRNTTEGSHEDHSLS